MSNNASDTQQVLSFLSQNVESYIPWIQRKEIASWAAILFLSAIFAFLFKFIFENYSTNVSELDLITVIVPLALFNIVFSIVIFAFIHSQFASMYYYTARSMAIRDGLLKTLKNIKSDEIDLAFDEETKLPRFLKEEFEKQMSFVQPYRNTKHPYRIILHFWSFDWLRKKENRKEENFSNHAKQEAAIYSLLIMANIVFLFIFVKILISYFGFNGF